MEGADDIVRETLALLDERLEMLDEYRKKVQEKLSVKVDRTKEILDAKRESLHKRLADAIEREVEPHLLLINTIQSELADGALDQKSISEHAVQADRLLRSHVFAEVVEVDPKLVYGNPGHLLELRVTTRNACMAAATGNPGQTLESILCDLEKAVAEYDSERGDAADKIDEKYELLVNAVDSMSDKVCRDLMDAHTAEDGRLQEFVHSIKERWGRGDGSGALCLCLRARAALVVEQRYGLAVHWEEGLPTRYSLKVTKEVWRMGERRVRNVEVPSMKDGKIHPSFDIFSDEEIKVLKERNVFENIKVSVAINQKDGNGKRIRCTLDRVGDGVTPRGMQAGTKYAVRIKTFCGTQASRWSEGAEFTPEFKECCIWMECPDYVDKKRKYSVDDKNPRTATKVKSHGHGNCTIMGNAFIPLNTVTSWSIKVLESRNNNGSNIFIGIAPFDINQNNRYNYNNGWYFGCYSSKLYSGPPHKYSYKEYGPRKEEGQYVHTGDSVGVVMDTTKGELSFVLNGVNRGVAYEGIPLDKPLVPCVLLSFEGDFVELDTSEVKENVDSSIPVLSNTTTKSTTWDTITLTWGEVRDASFYQIEVDGSISRERVKGVYKYSAARARYARCSWQHYICTRPLLSLSRHITTNTFTKRGLLPETEHSFRVRIVRGSSVSEWSDVVKGKTTKELFKNSGWKECPGDLYWKRKYGVDGRNPRVATKIDDDDYGCTTIGNTHIPLNKVTSWNVKILKSKKDNGGGVFIGIAQNDIDQNGYHNYDKCGWYFSCYHSTLFSGPPHSYRGQKYGPRKDYGRYVHTGDSVGVVMDTKKGELSFILNNVNLGVAYEGIPLDKPLVPCVILYYQGDSVELDLSEVKENVDSSVPVLSNITTKSTTWDSITLTWNEAEGASFYQIEVGGSKSLDASTANKFTKRGLLPETEHSFRVRIVMESSVGEWSDVVKGRTLKAPEFSECVCKTCPGDVDNNRKYSVDDNNFRIATKIIGNNYFCTIIGDTHIPPNKVTSWGIKILKSENNDGDGIFIGIAPSDIDQNEDNCNKCGWYFYCYSSSLCSGPPHKYTGKEYRSRKRLGQYVHIGDSVGVVMDTTNGDLSFALNGVNLGVAYEGIPLDKPLVPCVILYCPGDSVEAFARNGGKRSKENRTDELRVWSNAQNEKKRNKENRTDELRVWSNKYYTSTFIIIIIGIVLSYIVDYHLN